MMGHRRSSEINVRIVVGRRPDDANVCLANGFVSLVQGNWVEAVGWCVEDQLAFLEEALTETVFLVVRVDSKE